jgi:hypothetical protein
MYDGLLKTPNTFYNHTEYGYNGHRLVAPELPAAAALFENLTDVALFSPAFMSDNIQLGFVGGLGCATSMGDLRKYTLLPICTPGMHTHIMDRRFCHDIG